MNDRELWAWYCFNEKKLKFLSVWKCEVFSFYVRDHKHGFLSIKMSSFSLDTLYY
jgi:hypothetical protein